MLAVNGSLSVMQLVRVIYMALWSHRPGHTRYVSGIGLNVDKSLLGKE
jgi:hypothetical protein